MSYKKKLLLLIGISILILVLGAILEDRSKLLDNLAQFIIPFSFISLIAIVTLYFLPEPVFHAWKKFALWYIPIAAVFVLAGSTSSGSDLISMDAEFFTWFFAFIFFLTSLILIIRKSIKYRGGH